MRGTKHKQNDGVVSTSINTFAPPVLPCGNSDTINCTAYERKKNNLKSHLQCQLPNYDP